ncbi:MAG: PAS domain S-box protein [Clostridiales bacterium]|nr:PAS domain S-box protein [Clostridiales bacterium]
MKESEERYRAVVEFSHNGVLIVGEDYKFRYANDKLCEIVGYSREEIIGHDFREFLDEESKILVADRYVRRQRGEDVPPRYEFNIVKKDGEKRRMEISSTIVRDSKGKVSTIAQILDITERKRAEEALRASEEKYRILHEFAGEAIFTFGVDLKLMEINKAACDYVGAVREELLGRDIFELGRLHPDDNAKALENIQKILSGEKTLVVDKLRFKGKHGLYGIFQVTSTAVIRDGEIVAVTNVSRDVTLEEQLYSALEASERRHRFLFNAGNDAIFVYELTEDMKPGKFVEVNDLACMITAYSREELLRLSKLDLVVPEEKEQVYDSQLILSEKKHRVFERTFMTKDGRRIPSEVSSHLFELNGKPTVLAIVRDISERKKVEENLKAALKEKDVMLREIHHRVKNNMQIMSSLLRLQARQTTDEKAREALSESHTRIRSMAIIHEKLYQSKDFASIDFADYIEKMVTHLFAVYEVDTERVRFKIDVRHVEMDINRAIPCGLIINELVSNALKYAFPGGKKGELVIRMFRDEGGKYSLIVKDTGSGFPESIDVQMPQTLGLQIVADLTKQLDGKLELRRDGGTEIQITF